LRTRAGRGNAEHKVGSLTPIDPRTGKPGKAIPVDDPYNMYFSPDGKSAIVVAEAYKRLDFRDPATMELQASLAVPRCGGINHADFSIDGRYAIFTCEFSGTVAKIDLVERNVLGYTAHQARAADADRQGDRRPRRSDLHDLEGHAAGHPGVTGRPDVLRSRHDGGRPARDRRRVVPANGLHSDRHRHPWPLPEP
jgi:hypothetical protein